MKTPHQILRRIICTLLILIISTVKLVIPAENDSHFIMDESRREATVKITSIDQINFAEPLNVEYSTTALFRFLYDFPNGVSSLYLNITAKFFHPPYHDVWVGQNIALNPFESPVELNYYADLGILGALYGQQIIELFLYATVSDQIQIDPPVTSEDLFVLYPVSQIKFNVENGIDITEWPPMPQMNPVQHNWVLATDPTWIYRGCNVPNVDLDNSANPFYIDNTGVVKYGGDLGACTLASCANSISWLETQHPEINSGLNFREKLDCLDEMMTRDFYGNMGVRVKDIIAGTLDFIDSLKLPIKVKFQALDVTEPTIDSPNSQYGHSASNEGVNLDDKTASANRVSWDWIVNEMEAGEDVELTMGFWDGTGWTYAHTVVVTGVSKDKNVKKLTFKHDKDQENPGGLEEVQLDVTDCPGGWLSTNWMTNTNLGTCFITDVISKSYDPAVTFKSTAISPDRSEIPENFKLYQNYPNPFNPQTRITYNLHEACHVKLNIYNLTGQVVETLVNSYQTAGEHNVIWQPQGLSGGVYVYKLQGGAYSDMRKLIYQK
ncbi:T9SS type A sorting domain-containing protein [candidate division KSB1 bacterium]|nr:T9SS type A sorting domain-containing protein [candidate division KSB1 bacterium]